MSENRKGWEVWRFIEAGDGHVRIMSWHDKHILCSDEHGKVWTTNSDKNNAGESDKWDVELSPDGSEEGVVFKSVTHGRYLQAKNGGKLITCEFKIGTPSVWHITAANSQQFFLSSLAHNVKIGRYSEGGIFSNIFREDSGVWQLHQEDNGFVSLRSRNCGRFLSSDQNGKLYQTDNVGQNALWKIEISPTDNLHIVSKSSGRYLSSNESGEKFSTRSISHPEASECWSLEPVLPSMMLGKEMMKLSFVGSVTALSFMAAPSTVVGYFASFVQGTSEIHFITGGMAGMTSLEAIASAGGAIGSIAKVAHNIKTIGQAGMGLTGGAGMLYDLAASIRPSSMGESTTDTATDYNRPFCAWRSW